MVANQAKTGTLNGRYLETFSVGGQTYAAGDAFQIVQKIPGCMIGNLDSTVIESIRIIDYAPSASGSVTKPNLLFFFSNKTWEGSDDSASFDWSGSAANMALKETIEVITTDFDTGDIKTDYGTTDYYEVANLTPNLTIVGSGDDSSVYFQMITGGAPTFKANETITIEIIWKAN